MGISSLWSSRRAPTEVSTEVSLGELLEHYEIVQVNEEPGRQFAIITPKTKNTNRELGTSSPSPFTSFQRQEYNPALQGLRGHEVWDQMRKGDGTVKGSLRALKTPALSARWFMEPGGETQADKDLAELLWKNLTEWMSISWIQVLSEALLMLDFGYFMFEPVFENRKIGQKWFTVLTKLAPRHPMDVKEWRTDAHGGPLGVVMYEQATEGNPLGERYIPIDELLVFTFDREAGNMEGVSALRAAYKHWYFKEQLYKIDAIQKERHGIGIPMIKLPVGFSPEDKAAAEELGRNIRTNERAHIVLPPSWDICMLKLEGQPVDVIKSIEHHNAVIRENVLVNFIGEGASEDDLVMFFKMSRYIADIVSETYNLYLMRKWSMWNGATMMNLPRLRVRRIGEVADWRTLTFALRNLVGAGIVVPDDVLEAQMRDEMDLPFADPATARDIMTPQAPGDDDEDEEDGKKKNPKQQGQKAGLPRQTPVNKQGGKSRTGNGDGSGG